MKRKFILIGILGAALAASPIVLGAQKQRDVELQLRAAMNTELVDGDFKAAIEQYRKVVKSGIRPLAAQALLHIAECYRKLGDAEARKTYEQVVRDYSDQADVVSVARARLGTPSPTGAMASRRLWATDPESGWSLSTVSPDGRFVSYIDWGAGHLGVHEFATGLDRRLTKTGNPNWVEDAAFSRDSRNVAYNLFNSTTNRYELHVTSIDGKSDSRLLFKADDVGWIMPYDWSPDSNWIAVQLGRNGVGQMGLVSVRDGSLRLLRSTEWLGASRLFFSPDGKYVGYDLPVLENPQQRDVFVLAVAGGRQTVAATGPNNEWMMGWSLDGKHLLFSSDRGGTTGLWAIAVTDGQPHGEPNLLKTDIGHFSLGVSASGSLYSVGSAGDRDVRIASVDFSTGRLLSGPTRPIPNFVGTNSNPAWSPDGKRLAYRSDRARLGSAYINSDVIGILSLETGKSRELRPKLGYFQGVRWLPNGSLIVNGDDLNGNRRNYKVDPETGEISPFEGPSQVANAPKVYSPKDLGPEGTAVIERTVASGVEREVFRRKDLGPFFLSSDARFIAATTPVRRDGNNSGKPWTLTLLVANVDGGAPRELLRVPQPSTRSRAIAIWVADRGAFVVSSMLGEKSEQVELLVVPINGSRPYKIDVGATDFGNDIVFSPDRSQVAYTSGKSNSEVWVLDNFIGSLKTGK